MVTAFSLSFALKKACNFGFSIFRSMSLDPQQVSLFEVSDVPNVGN
jgi:hypothetical protein